MLTKNFEKVECAKNGHAFESKRQGVVSSNYSKEANAANDAALKVLNEAWRKNFGMNFFTFK